MLVLGALLALFAAGLWMYALLDVLLTPRRDCRNLTKGAWLAVTGLLFVPGAMAWLWFGRPPLSGTRYRPGRPGPITGPRWLSRRRHDPAGMNADEALRRHPAGRSRQDWLAETYPGIARVPRQEPDTLWPSGPDDDPDFLRYLDQVIRDIREAGNGTP